MENYRSNSNKSKQEERKKVEKVVSGAAQKGTVGKGGFFKSTVESVGQYLLHEILVPALKKTVLHAAWDAWHALLFALTR